MSKEEIKKRPKFFSEAILAVLIPIFGYLLAFSYEKGFCAYFNIPVEFIEINLINALKITGTLITITFIIWMFYEFLDSIKFFNNPIGRALSRILIPIILIPMAIYIFDLPWSYILIMYPVIFVLFVLPLFQRGIKGYKRKVEYTLNQDLKDEYLIDKLAKIIGPYTVVFLSFFIVGLGILNVAGGFNAKAKRTFMVIKSNPELVILRKYSKNFICTSFDRKKKEIKKNFYLKNVDQIAEQGLQIVVEDIGPLEVLKKEINNEVKKIKEN